jgi:hypothetical protein
MSLGAFNAKPPRAYRSGRRALVFVPSSGVAGAVVAVEPDHKHNRFPGATGELLS